jgi:hypothetical protein
MPTTHINPADAHQVIEAMKDSRRSGRHYVDVMHERDLLLTAARTTELVTQHFEMFLRDMDLISPEGVLMWFYGNTGPRTAAEMFTATHAWIQKYMEVRL